MSKKTKKVSFAPPKLKSPANPEDKKQETSSPEPWKIVIVDDDPEVHTATRLALKRFIFKDRGLMFLSAYSGEEAKHLLQAHPDSAVILLDVVMEADDTGLEVVKYIRNVLKNRWVRIILRTGQPGQAPEAEVIVDYDINDYKLKPELTVQRLSATLVASLRSYQDLMTIEANRKELAEAYANLEQEMSERKQLEQQLQNLLERRRGQVQTSTEVAQEIAAAPALDELLQRVVTLMQQRFGYYHSHIYTLDDKQLIMQEGTGEAGQQMKQTNHKIALAARKSLVARAARRGEPVLVSDVTQVSNWLSNPLLPNTRAELAVPIKLGNMVLGVLDVQSDTVGGLNEEDQLLLLGLCGQIAVFIRKRQTESEYEQSLVSLVQERNLRQTLIDNLPDLAYVKDTDSRFLLVNDATLRQLGAAHVDDVIGKTDFDFSPPELAEQYYADEQALFASGQSLVGHEEPVFHHETGMMQWLLSTKIIFRDEQGEVAGLIGLNRDITERRDAERRLQESEVLFQSLVDGFPQNVYRVDRDGRVLFGNKAYLATLGLTLEEVVGKTAFDLFPQELAEKYTADDRQVIETGQISDVIEVHKVQATGETIHVHTVKAPVRDHNDQIVGVQGIFWDVTERMQAEAMLAKRATELETVAEVGVATATILETDKLLQQVVDLTKARFGLYHAHIYLLNEAADTLDLAAGAGQPGRQMVENGWQIALDRQASLVAQAARTRQGVISNDVRQASNFLANPLLPGTRAELAVPLVVQDVLLGVLDVQSDKLDYFTDEDVRIQTIMGTQIAVALQNSRLFAQAEQTLMEIEEQARHSTALNKTSAILSQSLNLDTLFNVVAETISALVQADRTSMALLTAERDKLDIFALDGLQGAIPTGTRLPVEGTLVGQVAKTGEMIVDFAIQNSSYADAQKMAGQGVQSVVSVPLISSGQVLGSLNVASRRSQAFTPLDQKSLFQIASLLASNYEYRELLRQTQHRAEREQLINRISQKIQQTASVERALQTAIQELGEALQTPHIQVELAAVGEPTPDEIGQEKLREN